MKKNKSGYVTESFKVAGMTCEGCEKVIARQALSVKGVKDVKVDFKTGRGEVTYDRDAVDLDAVIKAINEKGYCCSTEEAGCGRDKKPYPLSVLLGIVVVLIGAYLILQSRLNMSLPDMGEETSIAMLFVIGLFTGFHCVAMCGGFVLSYSAREAGKETGLSLKSHLTYGFGKTLSYTIIGALFGFIGSVIAFTPFLRGVAAVLAGIFLVLFGLNMLGFLTWFRRFRINTPGFMEKINQKVSGGKTSPLAIGLLNGLMIACGPLQAIYLLAAASGSAYHGALYLLAFGLGTLPVMFGFGITASLVSSQLTHRLVRFSGVVVVLLGVVMVNRGLALSGSGYDLNTLLAYSPALAQEDANATNSSSRITLSEGYQTIEMNVTRYGWVPDRFVLKRGVPVRWAINGIEITTCNNAIQVPKLGLRFDVKPGLQTIEFTPEEEGVIPWSCWMGMIPGTFIVTDDLDVANATSVQDELTSVTLPKGGSCGMASGGSCGCGSGV